MATYYEGCAPEEQEVCKSYITDNRITALVIKGEGNITGRVDFDHSTRHRNDISCQRNDFDQTLRLEPYEARMIGKALIEAAERADVEIDRLKKEKKKAAKATQ